MSIEEVENKRRSRRTVHSRNEDRVSENGNSEFYDSDAILIQTPQGMGNTPSLARFERNVSL